MFIKFKVAIKEICLYYYLAAQITRKSSSESFFRNYFGKSCQMEIYCLFFRQVVNKFSKVRKLSRILELAL